MNNLHQFSDAEIQVLKDYFDNKLSKRPSDYTLIEFIDIDSIFEYYLPDIGSSNIGV